MKVIKNYLYNAGYQILLMLAPLLTTPYVARVLGPRESGINTYTNGWATLFYLVGQMGITLYGNREVAYNRDDIFKRSETFWSIEALQACTISISLIMYLSAVFLFSTTFQQYYLLQTFWIIAAGIDVSWYFEGLEDFKKTVSRNAIVKLASICMIFLFVRNESDLWKYILLLSLAQLIGNLTLWPYLRENVKWVSPKRWKPWKHLYPSLLFFIPTITTQVYLVVNKLMLGKIGQPTSLGQYDYSDRIVKLVLAIVTATGTVMLPHVANKFAKGDVHGVRQSLYTSFDFVTALAVPMMFGMMAISFKFAPWFLGNKYVNTGIVIFLESPVILLIAWSNVTGTQYLMPINRIREFTVSVTVGAIVNIISNFILIAPYAASGASVATVISEFSVTAVQLFFVRTTIKRRQLFKETWRYLIPGTIMFLIVFRFNQIMHMSFINLMVQVIIGCLVYLAGIIIFKAPVVKQAKKILKEK